MHHFREACVEIKEMLHSGPRSASSAMGDEWCHHLEERLNKCTSLVSTGLGSAAQRLRQQPPSSADSMPGCQRKNCATPVSSR